MTPDEFYEKVIDSYRERRHFRFCDFRGKVDWQQIKDADDFPKLELIPEENTFAIFEAGFYYVKMLDFYVGRDTRDFFLNPLKSVLAFTDHDHIFVQRDLRPTIDSKGKKVGTIFHIPCNPNEFPPKKCLEILMLDAATDSQYEFAATLRDLRNELYPRK